MTRSRGWESRLGSQGGRKQGKECGEECACRTCSLALLPAGHQLLVNSTLHACRTRSIAIFPAGLVEKTSHWYSHF